MDFSSKHFSQNNSMLPLIQPTDKIIVEPKPKTIHKDDIIVYKRHQNLIAHRVLHSQKNYIVTKGDYNLKPDKKISSNQVLGNVNKIIRDDKTIHIEHIYLAQSLKFSQEAFSISKSFSQQNIPHVFIKGLPIHLHYKNETPKHIYIDIDILIDSKHLKKAQRIIKKLKFKKSYTPKYLSDKYLPNQYNYYKTSLPADIVIDLHTEPGFGFTKSSHLNSLLPNQKIITKYFLTNIKKVKIQHNFIPILKTESQIILLLSHFFHHNFKQIQKLEIIKYIPDPSWKQMIRDIKKLHIENYIFPSIILFEQYYPNTVPKSIVTSIKKPWLLFIAKLHQNSVFNIQTQTQAGIHRLFLLLYLSDKNIIQKLSILINKTTLKLVYKTIKSFFSRVIKNSSTSTFA